MNPKKALYYLLNKYYYTQEYKVEDFCDRFSFIYYRELDTSSLTECEKLYFRKVAEITKRFSQFEEDHLNHPNIFYSDKDVMLVVSETIKELKIKPANNIREDKISGLLIEKELKTSVLRVLFQQIEDVALKYNWLITDVEIKNETNSNVGKKNTCSYSFLSGKELIKKLHNEDERWIWGVFSAIPKEILLEDILYYDYPTAEMFGALWKTPQAMQIPCAEIEIVIWDGKMLYIASKDKKLIEKIHQNISDSTDLSEY